MATISDECESSVGSYYSEEKLERKRTRESDGETSCNKLATKKNRAEAKPEPLIRCAWSGDFDVRYDESIYWRRIYSFNGFVSSKACLKVRDAVTAFEQVLQLEMVQRSSCWPKSFRRSGPTVDDIALYFFPSPPLHETLYDALLYEMINEDLAMRAVLQNLELLVFNSAVLRPPGGIFQGKFFLWGVFRSKVL